MSDPQTGSPPGPLYDDRFYDIQEEGSLRSARVIAPLVLGWVDAGSVLDVGCGVGTFLRAFAEAGIADVQGLDGDYVRRDRLRIDPSRFGAHDLSQPFDLGRRFGLVLSLEVAEHLPEERAEGFVDDLCRHGDVVLFGAAIPGQGGNGHINEQWQSHWAGKFLSRGYEAFDILRPVLWADPSVEFWYRQNTVIFANPDGIAAHPGLAAMRGKGLPLSCMGLVHPELLALHARQAARSRRVVEVFNQMAAQGGSYRFDKGADGSVNIVRIE